MTASCPLNTQDKLFLVGNKANTCWGATSAALLDPIEQESATTIPLVAQTQSKWRFNGHEVPHAQGYLRIVGLHQLALSQEEFKVPPVHVGQQHHWFLSLLYTDMSDRQQIPGKERNS